MVPPAAAALSAHDRNDPHVVEGDICRAPRDMDHSILAYYKSPVEFLYVVCLSHQACSEVYFLVDADNAPTDNGRRSFDSLLEWGLGDLVEQMTSPFSGPSPLFHDL